MALQNHPRMYSGGAVEFQSQPIVNIYAQHLQRKQAKEEALDNYEMNRINRMNEQGVRDIDRPGLDQRVLDMKMYYQANKDRIRKGGTPEAYNYEKMFRDTLGGVAKSKNATARAETFNKIRLERQKLGRNTPDEWFQDYTVHEDTPIWDEKFQELDIPKFMQQNTVKYDPKKTIDLFKDIKRTPGTPRYESIPGDKYGRNKFVDETFDKDSKETIAARASDLYDSNDGFAMEVQADFNNPIRRGELERISVQEFGTTPSSMSDYAAAKMLQTLQPRVTGKPKYEPLFEERQKLLQGYKKEIAAVYNTYKQMDRANQDYFIDAIYEDNIGEAARQNGSFDPSPFIRNKLGFMGKIPAKDFRIASDGYIEFNDGNTLQRISPNTYKSHLRDEFTAKAGTPQVQQSKANPKEATYIIKGKTYKEGELIKMGYTLDQIKPYKQ